MTFRSGLYLSSMDCTSNEYIVPIKNSSNVMAAAMLSDYRVVYSPSSGAGAGKIYEMNW